MTWLMLLLGIIVLVATYLAKGDILGILVVFFPISVIIGWLIDELGVRRLGFWEYTRYPYPSFRYFLVLPACWGIFGMTVNFMWLTIGNHWWTALTVYAILFVFQEGLNRLTKSWRYKVPFLLVVVGWFPLIFFFRAVFYLLWQI